MSSSHRRRKIHLRHPVVVDAGCNCRRSRFASLFSFSSSSSSASHSSSSKTKLKSTELSTTTTAAAAGVSASSWDPSFSSSSTPSPPRPPAQQQPKRNRRRRPRSKEDGRAAQESVAVVKETSEPYHEFKESMVQMIVEKEMYGWDDLNDLLHRFLSLNSPRHHHLILCAFADLWRGGVFSPPSPLGAASPPSPYYY